MSEEEVFNNLSLHFEDLVEKVIITKTKMKYSRQIALCIFLKDRLRLWIFQSVK